MPMPRLLKKLSLKSLRQRRHSTTSSNQSPSEETPPPLPSARSDKSSGYQTTKSLPNPTRSSSSANAPIDHSFPLPANGAVTNGTSYPVLPLPAVAISEPEDSPLKDLRDAWTSASTDPKVSKTDKVLLKLENGTKSVMARQEMGTSIVSGIKTGLEVVGGMEAIEKGLNTFMEGMPVLVKALDEVAKLHPYAVWALEQKRRDNDRKILALHMEMKDMMAVLIQLKHVKDAEEVAPDGTTIKGRMQEIVKNTAENIKVTCDTYSKKKLLVKVLKGPVWEGKLVAFAGTFTKRRGEFEFALSIHTAVGVDQANKAIKSVDQTTQEMNAKMDLMMKLFSQLVSPEQLEMTRMIKQRGGESVLDNDKALKELNEWENKTSASQGIATHGSKPAELDDLKDELRTDPDVAMEQNMVVFTRKLEVQTRQIIDEMSRLVERQGDRIISAVTAGPHDKIIDPDVHIVWKEMGWRGSVKARHFCMALRDHFQEEQHQGINGQAHANTVVEADMWALQYIDVVYLQAISEAFDDDASGFITVAEVNAFTTARPLDWSLPRWLAYWAIGHHKGMMMYATKIHQIMCKMFAIIPKILPTNTTAVNQYLSSIYEGVTTLALSVNAPGYLSDATLDKFKPYLESEEARLKGNLEAVKYDIDALDTLELVTGAGRIDRYALLVIYLLMQRHFEIFRICQTRTIHPDELCDAVDTIQYLFDAVSNRVTALQSLFKAQKLDLPQQFKAFAFGLFEYPNDLKLLWDPKRIQEAEVEEWIYDDTLEDQDIDASKILCYPVDAEPLDFDAYTIEPQSNGKSPERSSPLADILGLWHGHTYCPATNDYPESGMLSMDLKHSSTSNEGVLCFTATGRSDKNEFKITGEARVGATPDKEVAVTFTRTFGAHLDPQHFTGTWDASTQTLRGTVKNDDSRTQEEPTEGVSLFRRIKPEYLCFAPSPVALETNKPRALWEFAISAVLFDIRRKAWTWSYFKARRDNRKRFIQLYIRATKFGKPLSEEEEAELGYVTKTLTTSDSRFYHSLAEQRIQATTNHEGVNCDVCEGYIGGARISCLVCQMKDTFNTLDLCSAPECITERVVRDDMQRPHLPHHDLMKVRRVVHTRFFGKTYRDAKEALKHARTLFPSAQAGPSKTGVETDGDGSEGSSDTEDEEGHAAAVVQAKRASRLPQLAVSTSVPDYSRRMSVYTAGVPMTATSTAPTAFSGPVCSACKKRVSQPCWYCVQCAGSTFICWECDAKDDPDAVAFGKHDWHAHDLVRVQEFVEDQEFSVEEKLANLENRFEKHERKMEERLGRVEQLLEQLLSRMGS
ncbi:hypothetical protein R3P38DRAFT_2890069 [Favolaschia claudopus]|uniref:Vacuolar protein sorting-associated protein 13 second N-terminal domain-containing protein n=1 Tax=Favolaschia claudopus TaxID=2862362 RepID=A0AAW0CWF2_9AGAR